MEGVEEVLHRLSKDTRLRENIERMAEEEEKVLALGLGRFQRRMLVAVTCLADTLLDYALTIAKPASLTTSSWLHELALTLYTRWYPASRATQQSHWGNQHQHQHHKVVHQV